MYPCEGKWKKVAWMRRGWDKMCCVLSQSPLVSLIPTPFLIIKRKLIEIASSLLPIQGGSNTPNKLICQGENCQQWVKRLGLIKPLGSELCCIGIKNLNLFHLFVNWFKASLEGTARIPPSDVMLSTRWPSTDNVFSGSLDSWSSGDLKDNAKIYNVVLGWLSGWLFSGSGKQRLDVINYYW